jgi:hypothetical protein
MLSVNYLLHKEKHKLINQRFIKTNLSFLFPFYNQVKEALNEFGCEYEITLNYKVEYHTLMLDSNLDSNNYFFYHHILNTIPKYHHVKKYKLFKHLIGKYEFIYEICKPELQITIYYPEITIRNSHNKSKLLKDLYVRFVIDTKGNIDNISGTRTTLTKAEKHCGYHHSHLPRNPYDELKFQDFCLGTGTQILTSKVLFLDAVNNNQEIKNYFSLFLHNLDSVVKFESLEGMPYIKFSDVVIPKDKLEIKTFYSLLNDCIKFCAEDTYTFYIKMNHKDIMSCFTNINNELYLINKEAFEDLVFTEYFKSYPVQHTSAKNYVKVLYNNEELDLNNVVDSNANKDKYFYFNRKKKYLKVDEIKEIDKKLVTYRLSDDFINYSTKFIINKIKKIDDEKQRKFEAELKGEITNSPF